MFYKLIFNESDKRKKIDPKTETFEGLQAFAQKVFKMGEKDVGFLYLGQDDVSAYEITCDEDLEYVLEVSKSSSSNSKFVVIKVIENFENSPENPDKFSRLDASEEEKKDLESFENLSSAIAKSKLVDEPEKEDLRNDLENFDKKIIQKNEEIKEEKEMINNLEKMIKNSEVNMKEFIEESIKEDVPDMIALNKEMEKVDIEPEIPENKPVEEAVKPVEETVPIVPKKVVKKKNIKKMKKKIKKKMMKKILKKDNIKELASHLTESMLLDDSENKKLEIENKIGDILNATLSQISQKFEKKQKKLENKQKKMEQRKNGRMIGKYFKYCGKIKKKMHKINHKMTKLYENISEEARVKLPFNNIIWSNQAQGFNSMESEHLKMELNHLAASRFQQMDQIEHLSKRNQELEAMIQNLQSGKPVEKVTLGKKSSVSVETQHLNIICDGCQTANFKGRRFKCIVCPDFDLCESCEGSKIHSHPMLRMTCNNIETRKLNLGLKFLRERPRFQKLFNLSPEEVGDNEERRKCRRKKFWWMKKMFGGKKRWGKKCGKRSHSTSSSSSSSEESNSPQKHHGKHHHGKHHHRRRMWKRFAKNMHKKGAWWMNQMPFAKKKQHNGPNPWFIDFSKDNELNKELKNCARPFPGFIACDFKKQNPCEKKVKAEEKKMMKETIEKKFENKTGKELVPKKIQEELNKMGVEIVDFYVDSKDAPKKNQKLGPNDIKVEIDILPPVEEKKPDMMSEDRLIRKSSKTIGLFKPQEKIVEEKKVEDFKIECETPERAKSSEEIEIEQRKEYVRLMLDNSNINDEILHFFVVNNLDLEKEQFYKLMNEQKKFLSN